ncbi:MAG: hypothetical protein WDW36_007740 [Sanguina aurantia]
MYHDTSSAGGFVQRSGSQLQLDGKPFYFVGANAYWLIASSTDRSKVDTMMAKAKGLGLKVLRTWAFNSRLPHDNGRHGLAYDETQFRTLDYVVHSARNHGIKLILALGNLWPAYVGPENYLQIATGTAAGKTVADFYSDPAAQRLYASNIDTITARINSYSKIAYHDDDAIMMWDVLNEPRCPGCDTAQLASHQAWLASMASHAKAAAPKQLISPATEGYFLHSNVQSNPGAGASCEGEDFPTVSALAGFDVATAHIYYRQTESVPGQALSFELVGVQSKQQQNVLFEWVTQQLIASKNAGGPLAGVMFWEAGMGGVQDFGYAINMRRSLQALPSPALPRNQSRRSLPQPAPTGHTAKPHLDDATRDGHNIDTFILDPHSLLDAAGAGPLDTHLLTLSDSTSGSPSTPDPLDSKEAAPVRLPRTGSGREGETPVGAGRSRSTSGSSTGSDRAPTAKLPASAAGGRAGSSPLPAQRSSRRLADSLVGVQEELDPFRRFEARRECAEKMAASWVPAATPEAVDVGAYMTSVSGKSTVDILRHACQMVA